MIFARPPTETGDVRCVVVPSPSWPLPLAPQHRAVPLARSAQVELEPAEICTTSVRPKTAVGVTTVEGEVLPIPICPLVFNPQHCTVVFASSAQLCQPPVAICVAVTPGTRNGVDRVVP